MSKPNHKNAGDDAMPKEYIEGTKAGENFEKLARAVFRAPKVAAPKKQPEVKPKHRKTTGKDKA